MNTLVFRWALWSLVIFQAGLWAQAIPSFPAQGEVGGDTLNSTVDSEVARYYLQSYLRGKRERPELDGKIEGALASLSRTGLTDDGLKTVADQGSVDLAALLFAHLITQRQFPLKIAYLQAYEEVKADRLALGDASKRYKILLVPGLFYVAKPETKGDLREVKEALESQGFEVARIPILEAGTVEQNGRIIADYVKAEPMGPKRLILVSTSKGGPDTLAALGQYHDSTDASKVALWFSIGGALGGSYLADDWSGWPKRWLASIVGIFAGFSSSMVQSLSVNASRTRAARTQIPGGIRIIHFVGVPVSGSVIPEVRDSYQALRRYGPNDGITLLPDEILPGAEVITAAGLDHWYRDPDLRRKILALVSVATEAPLVSRRRQ